MNKTAMKLLGIFSRYLVGFLIGLAGAFILYIERPAFLTCKYAEGCETRECQIDCILEKRWGGLLTSAKKHIYDFKGIASASIYVKSLKSGETDKYYYHLVMTHSEGETELTPEAGESHHFPSRDSIVKKVNDFTNAGPTNEVLVIWQANWLMMLIGYSLLAIWPLQVLNIIVTVWKKTIRKR